MLPKSGDFRRLESRITPVPRALPTQVYLGCTEPKNCIDTLSGQLHLA